ncbi:MAG: diadenylate cyclase [Gemmatimonadota bacterium]|nr:diadenylate cyclase [Gemmatimonadota bacterium]
MARENPTRANTLLKTAASLSGEIGADLVLLVADSGVTRPAVQSLNNACPVLLVTRRDRFLQGVERMGIRRLRLDFDDVSHLERVRQGIVLGMEAGHIQMGSRLICLANVMEHGGVDTLMTVDTRWVFEDFDPESLELLAGDLPVEVVKAVLDIALDIGREGREGEQVGTLFVLGDSDRVLANSRVMTYDPFRGYSKRERNICDPDNREGVKEVALMDGAFIVQEDGVIRSGCRYITSNVGGLTLPKGLGARHVAAAAVSRNTNAIAVAVSESTGTVRVFKRGEIVLRRDPGHRIAR